MSKREKIDKWSAGYRFLQWFIVGPLYRYFFRKIEVNNINKVPEKESIILAPNHQNALMDALAFVGNTDFQTVFLARADIFKKDLVVKILTYIKILPVYRIRDGRSELQKNDEIFEVTQKILRNRYNPLCLYPEGNHGDRRRLRPLVKGIFRIAFRAQEEYGTKPAIKIIPVGIDYGHYWKFRHTLFINFGDPIDVSDYWAEYEEAPSVAMNRLRDKLAQEMKKVMVHIESEEFYPLYMALREILRRKVARKMKLNAKSLTNRYQIDREIIARLDRCLENEPERISNLNLSYNNYAALRDKLNYRDWVPAKGRYSVLANIIAVLGSVVVLPLVALGLVNNWPNLLLPRKFTRKIKDEQFHSTAIWGAGTAMVLIYYPILAILAIIVLPFWWLKLMYIITIPSSGIFAFNYRNFLIKSWAKIKYSFPWGGISAKNNELRKRYKALNEEAMQILEDYQ